MQEHRPSPATGGEHRPTRQVQPPSSRRNTTRPVSAMPPEKREAALSELTSMASKGADRASMRDKGLQIGVPTAEVAMLVEKAVRDGRPPGHETGIIAPPAPHLHGYAPDQPPPPGPVQPYSPATRQYAHAPAQAQPQSSNAALVSIGIGLLLMVGGGIATVVSYDTASEGGRYTIWWGAIIIGLISLIRGIYQLSQRR